MLQPAWWLAALSADGPSELVSTSIERRTGSVDIVESWRADSSPLRLRKTGVRPYWPPLSLVQHHFQHLGFVTDPDPGHNWNVAGAFFPFN
jgi:hypothetical protein